MLTTDRVAGGALVVVGLIALFESRRLPLGTLHRPGPAYMPVVLALLLIVFGLVLALMASRGGRFADVGWHEWRHAVAIFGACAFAAWGFERLGYRLTTAIVLFFLLFVVERRSLALSVGLTLVIAWGTFFLFDTLLRVPLPRGPLLGL